MSTSATDHSARQRWVRGGIWLAVAAVLLVLPMQFPSFRVEQFCSWMALAVAACGLNLLTGYNGQISVGHGALYGVGAYATAILITKAQWPMFAAAVAAAGGGARGMASKQWKGHFLFLSVQPGARGCACG
jgi:branched-chain amino acid transport system permease protein